MAKNADEYRPGRLVEDDGTWALDLDPEDMDELAFLFEEEWGEEPNGHSWGAVIETLISTHFPERVPHLTVDAEGDGCWVLCSDPEPLGAIARMLRNLLQHPEELREALQKTDPD